MKMHDWHEMWHLGMPLLCVLFLVSQAARAKASPSDNDQFAVIAGKLDVSVDTNGVRLSSMERHGGSGAPKIPVRRMISSGLEIETEQVSEKIRWIANDVARRKAGEMVQHAKQQGRKLLPTKTREEAMALAIAYAEKLGQPITPDLILAGAGFRDEEGEWGFGWLRDIRGFRFAEEGVSVSFADKTGELCIFNNSVTDNKCPTDVKITEDAAKKTAEERAKAMLPILARGSALEVAKVGKPSLQIVYPNAMYKETVEAAHSTDSLQPSTEPRLVYEVVFSFSDTGRGPIRRSRPPVALWIDAATGQLVGGR